MIEARSRGLGSRFGVVAVVVAVLLAGTQRPGQAAPRPTDVNVINAPSVNVANNPGVNVLNSPAVSIANSPSVEVLSSQADAVWTRDAGVAPTPFQASATVSFSPGDGGGLVNIVVPEGQRLVIETVSALAALENGQAVRSANITTLDQVGGNNVNHYLVMTAQGSIPDIADYYAANHAFHAYAIGTIGIQAFRTSTVGSGQVDVTISGYLVAAN